MTSFRSAPSRRSLLAAAAGGMIAAPYVARAQMVPNYPWSGGVVVETANGRLRGYPDGPVNIFKDIPYGAGTGGANRFLPPRPVQPWTGLREAVRYGNQAMQGPTALIIEEGMALGVEPMSEDCLRLNVWTPAVGPNSGKRPVMVWFHGGGYAGGSGGNLRNDGTNLARDHDVVVITVNHRLNIFGFLYLADLGGGERFAQASNAGALDMVAALRWVRDNIAMFGGDPGNVTIFGQSGGGRKVSTLMAMPEAKGLFHRAISQSGMDIRQTTREAATDTARRLMTALDLTPQTLGRIQELPAATIQQVAATARIGVDGPTVDGRTIPNHPVDPTAPAFSADVPWMMGNTQTEAVWQPTTPLDPIDAATLRENVKRNMRVDDAGADALIAVYRKGRPRVSNEFLYQVIASDNWLTVNMSVAGERKAALGRAPAYVYRYDKETPVRGGKLHSPHTVEIPYVFDNWDVSGASVMLGHGADRAAWSKKMSDTWVAFARTGDPNNPGIPRWPAYNAQTRPVMVFDTNTRVENAPHEAERQAMLAIRRAQATA